MGIKRFEKDLQTPSTIKPNLSNEEYIYTLLKHLKRNTHPSIESTLKYIEFLDQQINECIKKGDFHRTLEYLYEKCYQYEYMLSISDEFPEDYQDDGTLTRERLKNAIRICLIISHNEIIKSLSDIDLIPENEKIFHIIALIIDFLNYQIMVLKSEKHEFFIPEINVIRSQSEYIVDLGNLLTVYRNLTKRYNQIIKILDEAEYNDYVVPLNLYIREISSILVNIELNNDTTELKHKENGINGEIFSKISEIKINLSRTYRKLLVNLCKQWKIESDFKHYLSDSDKLNSSIESEKNNECPTCGMEISNNDEICSYCGMGI